MNKLRSNKLFALFVALSSVIIIAGIVLYAVLGFNNAQDKPATKYIDVTYGAAVVNGTVGEEDAPAYLEKSAEEVLSTAGLSFEKDHLDVGAITSGNIGASGQQVTVRYSFANATDDALEAAAGDIAKALASQPAFADVTVAWHTAESLALTKAAWRGAIALAVGAVVALIYVTVRFGVSCGVAGLVVCCHDALFTAAIFAIARIPVFGFAPLLYAGVAAFASAAVWTVVCIKLRSAWKAAGSEEIKADALADTAAASSWKLVLCIAGALAAVVLVLGLVAAAGTRALVLPAIVGCLVPAYSSLLIGLKVFEPIRKAFDKKRASKKGGYVRKKKKAELEAEE